MAKKKTKNKNQQKLNVNTRERSTLKCLGVRLLPSLSISPPTLPSVVCIVQSSSFHDINSFLV